MFVRIGEMSGARFDSADPGGGGWHATLQGLRESHTAWSIAEVRAVVAHADRAAAEGRWAALVLSYEAAPAFERAMRFTRPPSRTPLAWVGIYDRASTDPREPAPATGAPAPSAHFAPSATRDEYTHAVRSAQEYIRAGDTYQVNVTFRMHGRVQDPDALYDHLLRAQQARYCACLDIDGYRVLSFSPELFFERRGNVLTTRPMKGTTRRGRYHAEDEALAGELAASRKAQAENVMIVDLLRNDAGRIAVPGGVRVPELFTLERYPTLWQMTSTVEAQLRSGATLLDLLDALFPCGSITGAPKIRTMQIIDELEGTPRGLYTGTIGLVRPGGDCIFNVAIRTIVIDRETGAATMGVGAGIVTDSVPEDEYDECLLKASFATAAVPPPDLRSFSLLETMRLSGGTVVRLDRHLARMRDSAAYFGFPWRERDVRTAVTSAAATFPGGTWRMRLLLAHDGTPTAECLPHTAGGERRWRLAVADSPVDAADPFLFNKTTRRDVYEAARRAHPGADDVLLWNARGEITEATIANVVVEIDGVRYTPPVTSGLLPGVLRGELVEAGDVRERVLTKDDVASASQIWLINSLRGWIPAELID